ncbi:MAG: hypothetical protein ACI9E5_001184 [Candidatus Omnitrophota bacterium]|jgi:hypothetical protein
MWSSGSVSMDFSSVEPFPDNGRIEIEVYVDLKRMKVPFKVENISLVGFPTS